MDIKRDGAPTVSVAQGNTVVLSWPLTGQPDGNWQVLFGQPDSYDTSHSPQRINLVGTQASVTCSRDQIDSYVSWFDKWAEMANSNHAALEAENERQRRARQEEADRERADVAELNTELAKKYGGK